MADQHASDQCAATQRALTQHTPTQRTLTQRAATQHTSTQYVSDKPNPLFGALMMLCRSSNDVIGLMERVQLWYMNIFNGVKNTIPLVLYNDNGRCNHCIVKTLLELIGPEHSMYTSLSYINKRTTQSDQSLFVSQVLTVVWIPYKNDPHILIDCDRVHRLATNKTILANESTLTSTNTMLLPDWNSYIILTTTRIAHTFNQAHPEWIYIGCNPQDNADINRAFVKS